MVIEVKIASSEANYVVYKSMLLFKAVAVSDGFLSV